MSAPGESNTGCVATYLLCSVCGNYNSIFNTGEHVCKCHNCGCKFNNPIAGKSCEEARGIIRCWPAVPSFKTIPSNADLQTLKDMLREKSTHSIFSSDCPSFPGVIYTRLNPSLTYDFDMIILEANGRFTDKNREAYESVVKARGADGWILRHYSLVTVPGNEDHQQCNMGLYLTWSRIHE